MRNIVILIFVCVFLGFSFVDAGTTSPSLDGEGYQTQGFDKFSENRGTVFFECSNQCFIFLGEKGQGSTLTISGNFLGDGVVGYGFLANEAVVPGDFVDLDLNSPEAIEHTFLFSDLSFYGELPNAIQTLLVVQGTVSVDALHVDIGNLNFLDTVKKGRNDFWSFELLTPYSINLRYGVKVLGISIVSIGYIIATLLGVLLLFFGGGSVRKRYERVIYLVLIIFLFIGIRNLITYTAIVNKGIQEYTFAEEEERTFFDLGDYIVFTDKVRKKLGLDNISTCDIYIKSYQDWPFKSHWQLLYLKPCQIVDEPQNADYHIFYKEEVPSEYESNTVLIEFNESTLLENN